MDLDRAASFFQGDTPKTGAMYRNNRNHTTASSCGHDYTVANHMSNGHHDSESDRTEIYTWQH